MLDFHFSTILQSHFSATVTYLNHMDCRCPAIAARECCANQLFAVGQWKHAKLTLVVGRQGLIMKARRCASLRVQSRAGG